MFPSPWRRCLGPLATPRDGRRPFQPYLEALEDRCLLSLTLTPQAQAAGFGLSTFATGFLSSQEIVPQGPVGITFLPNGGVLVGDLAGNLRLFPSDTDGQSASNVAPEKVFNGPIAGLASAGGNLYLNQMTSPGHLFQINADGSIVRDVADIDQPRAIAVNPANGHLYVSTVQGPIYEVDPGAPAGQTTRVLVSVAANGLAFDPATNILYVVEDFQESTTIKGFDVRTGNTVFGPIFVGGGPAGLALGTGTLAGNLFVNTTAGTVVEVSLATTTDTQPRQTLIASGGSGGDLIAVDPNGTLLLTQSTEIDRLHPPQGGGFLFEDDTVTTVVASPASSVLGQAVTFTATVTPAFTGFGAPTGTVTFAEGGTTLGTAPLNASGQATFTTSALALGTHVITATYSGDDHFITSTGTASEAVAAISAGPPVKPVKGGSPHPPPGPVGPGTPPTDTTNDQPNQAIALGWLQNSTPGGMTGNDPGFTTTFSTGIDAARGPIGPPSRADLFLSGGAGENDQREGTVGVQKVGDLQPTFEAGLGLAHNTEAFRLDPLSARLGEMQESNLFRLKVSSSDNEGDSSLLLFRVEGKALRIASSLGEADDSVELVESLALALRGKVVPTATAIGLGNTQPSHAPVAANPGAAIPVAAIPGGFVADDPAGQGGSGKAGPAEAARSVWQRVGLAVVAFIFSGAALAWWWGRGRPIFPDGRDEG